MGIREANKKKTRRRISDIATQLFMERGYKDVSIAEIAAKSEVSEKTVFNYFPKKESLVFDIEDEFEEGLISAIRDRKSADSLTAALHRHLLKTKILRPSNKALMARFMNLISTTPELENYRRGMYARYSKNLAKEIRSEFNGDLIKAECFARLVLESLSFASTARSPYKALTCAFDILENGYARSP